MENLMSALGQESEKVDRLVELLQQRGFDPTGVLDEVRLYRLVCDLLTLPYGHATFGGPVLREWQSWGSTSG